MTIVQSAEEFDDRRAVMLTEEEIDIVCQALRMYVDHAQLQGSLDGTEGRAEQVKRILEEFGEFEAELED